MLKVVLCPVGENLEVTHMAGEFPEPGMSWELGNSGSSRHLHSWLEMIVCWPWSHLYIDASMHVKPTQDGLTAM